MPNMNAPGSAQKEKKLKAELTVTVAEKMQIKKWKGYNEAVWWISDSTSAYKRTAQEPGCSGEEAVAVLGGTWFQTFVSSAQWGKRQNVWGLSGSCLCDICYCMVNSFITIPGKNYSGSLEEETYRLFSNSWWTRTWLLASPPWNNLLLWNANCLNALGCKERVMNIRFKPNPTRSYLTYNKW